MKIAEINNANYKKNSVSSKAYIHKTMLYKTSPLKNIPGNICACCGNEMITSSQQAKFWAKVTLPISNIFTHKYFEVMKEKYPQIYKVLDYFVKEYPDKSFPDVILDENNHAIFYNSVEDAVISENGNYFPTALAYRKALKNRIMDIINVFERDLKASSEVIKEIKPFAKYMMGSKKEVFEKLEQLSSQYPDKKIHELVQMPEVAEKHAIDAYYDAVEFVKKRDYFWDRADNIILKNNSELEDELEKLHKKISLIYNDGDYKRTSFLIQKLYKDFITENHLEYLEKEVMEEIHQLPVRELTSNVYFSVAKNNRSDGAIVRDIIRPFTEGEKRLDSSDDYESWMFFTRLVMCRKCCDNMGTLPFSEFSMYNPQMTQNTKNQIDLYERKVLDGSIDFQFREYPIGIAKKLNSFTDGAINVDTSEYWEKIKELEKREKLLEKY